MRTTTVVLDERFQQRPVAPLETVPADEQRSAIVSPARTRRGRLAPLLRTDVLEAWPHRSVGRWDGLPGWADVADLDRHMWDLDVRFERTLTKNGEVTILAKGRSAIALAVWLADLVEAGPQRRQILHDRKACRLA
jgi:hypothetical protein